MANKVVTYIELLEMIKNKEIKEGVELLDNYGQLWFYDEIDLILKKTDESIGEREYISDVINMRFEILSELKEIAIENLEELPIYENIENYNNMSIRANRLVINDLIKVVKQINKKLEER